MTSHTKQVILARRLSNVRGEITKVTLDMQKQITSIGNDVHYLRGRQDQRDIKE